MSTPAPKPAVGFRRVIKALGYSYAGIRYAVLNEPAVREELVVLAIFIPISVLLPINTLEHLMLVVSMLLVVLVELINSAIETVVNRISLERNPLSGEAKDLASAAVFVAMCLSGLCWFVIAGPVVIHWLDR